MASPMEFWGVEVKAGVPTKVVPKDDMLLHLSQACVANAKNGSEQALISVKVGDQKLLLGALSAEKQPQISFDLVFEKEFELSHTLKSGSVHFLGYQTFVNHAATGDDEFSDFDDSSEDEEVPLDLTENGVIQNAVSAKPAPAKLIAAKPESSGKQKVKIEVPIKDDDSDVGSEDDDSDGDDDISGESDSEMAEGDSEDDDSDEEEEETPTPKKVSKKRPNESASKTPVSVKKAKPVTPQKTDGKNVHNATPHPAKKSGKTAEKTPKSGGDLSCKSCSKTFGSDGALQSHNKAKHSAGK